MRRIDAARRLEAQLAGIESEAAVHSVGASVGDAISGFTPEAAWELTQRVREACADADGLVASAVPAVRVDMLLRILASVEQLLHRGGAPALVEMMPPPGRLVVVGDTHGQLQDLGQPGAAFSSEWYFQFLHKWASMFS